MATPLLHLPPIHSSTNPKFSRIVFVRHLQVEVMGDAVRCFHSSGRDKQNKTKVRTLNNTKEFSKAKILSYGALTGHLSGRGQWKRISLLLPAEQLQSCSEDAVAYYTPPLWMRGECTMICYSSSPFSGLTHPQVMHRLFCPIPTNPATPNAQWKHISSINQRLSTILK